MDRLNRDSGNGMVNKGILLNNMKYLSRNVKWHFDAGKVSDLNFQIKSDFTPIYDFDTKTWPLPNHERFPWNICDGCGIQEGNTCRSGHLVPSF